MAATAARTRRRLSAFIGSSVEAGREPKRPALSLRKGDCEGAPQVHIAIFYATCQPITVRILGKKF